MYPLLTPALSDYRRRVFATCLVVALAALARHIVAPLCESGLTHVLFYPVVIVCAWFGGASIGVLATVLSVISLALFFRAHPGLGPTESWLALSSLAVEGVAVSFFFAWTSRRLMQSYEQQVQHLKIFVAEAPLAIAMFDTRMRYIAVSKRWLADLHLEGCNVIGRSHYEVFPEIPERWKDVHQRCLAGATLRGENELFVREDGTKQWFSWEARPWMENPPSKSIGGILIFAEDVTKVQEAHEHETTLRAEAEVACALRSEAESAVRIKDEFIATLSHELRGPLNAMLGWIQLLKRLGSDPDRLTKAMSAIERSGHVLAQLISDILDINRIASGKLRLTISDVSVVDAVQCAIDAVAIEVQEKNITIDTHCEGTPHPVRGDAVRLQQCVWNVLSNAIKFTPLGGRITVSTHFADSQLQISVTDTGCGIRPEMLSRLFERSVQADTSSARTHGGLGLGLAIVRHIVELHGGSVAAHSNGVGTGSTFTISLPFSTSLPVTPALDATHGALPDGAALRDLSFLVVDDHLEARELLRSALEDCGAKVYTAPSAERAAAIAAQKSTDIVISDIEMNGRDGYAFIREIRSAGVATPAIALSANTSPAAEQHALSAGFNRYLTKPVNLDQLLVAVKELI